MYGKSKPQRWERNHRKKPRFEARTGEDTSRYVYGFHAVSAVLTRSCHRSHPSSAVRRVMVSEQKLANAERSIDGADRAMASTKRETASPERSPTQRLRQIRELCTERSIPWMQKTDTELEGLCGDPHHQGIVAELAPFSYMDLDELLSETPNQSLFVALDEITDPRNFGAILRSALAFNAQGVVVPKHRSAAITSVVTRTSTGASEILPVAQVTNLSQSFASFRRAGMAVVGLDVHGTSITELRRTEMPEAGVVLVIGSEGKGLRRLVAERCDSLISIPMQGPVESLNASVAASIALFWLRQLPNFGHPA